MKICIIPDVHARKIWRDIVNFYATSELFIFMGDYCDPYDENISNGETLAIVKDIIDFKNQHPEKVILLQGNHDAQYMFADVPRCGSYDYVMAKVLTPLYRSNLNKFQVAYQKGNNLFTHAGVTTSWLYSHIEDLKGLKDDLSNLGLVLNRNNNSVEGRECLFDISKSRKGRDEFGGPMWAGIDESYNDYLFDFQQYVSHSKVTNIVTYGDKEQSITYCDTMHKKVFNVNKDILTLNL